MNKIRNREQEIRNSSICWIKYTFPYYTYWIVPYSSLLLFLCLSLCIRLYHYSTRRVNLQPSCYNKMSSNAMCFVARRRLCRFSFFFFFYGKEQNEFGKERTRMRANDLFAGRSAIPLRVESRLRKGVEPRRGLQPSRPRDQPDFPLHAYI